MVKIRLATENMDRRIRSGVSPEDAWNQTSIELAHCAESHCRAFLVMRFVENVRGLSCVSKQLHEVLMQLCELYSIYWVLQRLGDFLRFSCLNNEEIPALQARFEEMLAAIRPNAVGIVDGFDIRDEILASALGAYDGNVYQRLFDEAMKSPLNQESVNQSFHKYLKPFLKNGVQACLWLLVNGVSAVKVRTNYPDGIKVKVEENIFADMDKLSKPQIICHIEKSVDYSLFDAKWIPCSAKFVVMGSRPRGTGIIQIYEISSGELKLVKDIEKSNQMKCGTFKASSLRDRYLATGDFKGKLNIYNLEDPSIPVYSVNAHTQIINAIDGVAGTSVGCGAPELVTGSRDGSVKVWDPRQKNRPVAVMEPKEGESRRDCWSVGFGNSYNSEERVVAAGYDNGDVKMFDLKTMSLRWESNLKNGVCGLEFDRKDIPMNKLVATTLESKFYLFDLKTQHPKKGFAYLVEKAHKSTIWLVKHLPQNRELFATCGGGGTICLWKYNYPEKRKTTDADGIEQGVVGNVSLLQNCTLSSQPVSSLDWSPDKQGLAVCTSFDQCLRVIITTKLNTY